MSRKEVLSSWFLALTGWLLKSVASLPYFWCLAGHHSCQRPWMTLAKTPRCSLCLLSALCAALPWARFVCCSGEDPSGCQIRGRLTYICRGDESESQTGVRFLGCEASRSSVLDVLGSSTVLAHLWKYWGLGMLRKFSCICLLRNHFLGLLNTGVLRVFCGPVFRVFFWVLWLDRGCQSEGVCHKLMWKRKPTENEKNLRTLKESRAKEICPSTLQFNLCSEWQFNI